MKTKHKCRFKLRSWTNEILSFGCSCGLSKDRKSTKKEQKQLNIRYPLKAPLSENAHIVWHNFANTFFNNNGKFKIEGYALATHIEKWALKYPSHVKIVHCDDHMFMGSRIFLIEHKAKDAYMGTTFIYVPQAGSPKQGFLYPSHRNDLIKALSSIKKESAAILKRARIIQQKRSKYLDSIRY